MQGDEPQIPGVVGGVVELSRPQCVGADRTTSVRVSPRQSPFGAVTRSRHGSYQLERCSSTQLGALAHVAQRCGEVDRGRRHASEAVQASRRWAADERRFHASRVARRSSGVRRCRATERRRTRLGSSSDQLPAAARSGDLFGGHVRVGELAAVNDAVLVSSEVEDCGTDHTSPVGRHPRHSEIRVENAPRRRVDANFRRVGVDRRNVQRNRPVRAASAPNCVGSGWWHAVRHEANVPSQGALVANFGRGAGAGKGGAVRRGFRRRRCR